MFLKYQTAWQEIKNKKSAHFSHKNTFLGVTFGAKAETVIEKDQFT